MRFQIDNIEDIPKHLQPWCQSFRLSDPPSRSEGTLPTRSTCTRSSAWVTTDFLAKPEVVEALIVKPHEKLG